MSGSLVIDTTELIPGCLIIGETGHGVLGSTIPATGMHGPAYAYDVVSARPGFAGKEYRGTLDALPQGVAINADERTTFTAKAVDGVYTVTWTLFEDGVEIGSADFTLRFGNG